MFYLLERFGREDGQTQYFQAPLGHAVASPRRTSGVRREPYMGSTQQLAVPLRERFVYTLFWTIVLAVKLAFGHFYLVLPLREAIMALQHPDLCWNKESDEYTSCINLEGDDLMKALRFTPKTKYFIDEEKEDYEELQESIDESPMEDLSFMNDVKNVDRIATGRRRVRGEGARPPGAAQSEAKALLLSAGAAGADAAFIAAPAAGGTSVSYYSMKRRVRA